MSISSKQLIEKVIRPALQDSGLYSTASLKLVAGTAATESGMGEYLVQIKGPALGIFQMEPATHDDLWKNFILLNPAYRAMMVELFGIHDTPSASRLIWNLRYATVMCRLHYRRVKAPLPEANNILGLANYWKKYYNTHLGAGEPQDFVVAYMKHCHEALDGQV